MAVVFIEEIEKRRGAPCPECGDAAHGIACCETLECRCPGDWDGARDDARMAEGDAQRDDPWWES